MCATSRNHDMVTDPTIGQSADRPSSDMIPIRSVRLSHLPIDGFVCAFGDQRCLPGLIPTFCGDHPMKWIWLSTLLVVISFGANPGYAQTTPDDPFAIRAKGMKRLCHGEYMFNGVLTDTLWCGFFDSSIENLVSLSTCFFWS